MSRGGRGTLSGASILGDFVKPWPGLRILFQVTWEIIGGCRLGITPVLKQSFWLLGEELAMETRDQLMSLLQWLGLGGQHQWGKQ